MRSMDSMGDPGFHVWTGPFDIPLTLQCMKQHRVTHIHVRHTDVREELRRAERSDLISVWNPPCNDMR